MYIFLETDNFKRTALRVKSASEPPDITSGVEPSPPVRRPLRGIQIKEETYAVLSVRRPDGSAIPLISSSAIPESVGLNDNEIGRVSEYADFLLQQVEDQRTEKSQIIETFGEAFVYFFGERPRIVSFNGYLLNTADFNWHAQFWHNYDKYLRGTKLVQQNARCYLAYDTVVVEGYPLSANAVMQAENTNIIPFSISMLMTNYHEYSTVGLMRFPGPNADTLEVLDKILDDRRKGFTSTTVEVRKGNLDWVSTGQLPGPKPGSPLGFLRKGIQSYNEMRSWAGRQINKAQRIASGRALRMPIGAAAYYAGLRFSTANVTAGVAVAYGSVTSTAQNQLNESGTYGGNITVSGVQIKSPILYMMSPAKFAAPWESAFGGTKGYIFENYDEYPLRKQPSSLAEINQKAADIAARRAEARIAYMKSRDAAFKSINMMTARGGVLENIASAVRAVRDGYGMVATVLDTVDDPLGKLTQQLGVTVPDLERIGMGALRRLVPPLMFVGTALGRTFENQLEDVLDPTEYLFDQGDSEEGAASIGDVYKQTNYKASVSRVGSTEDAYKQSTYKTALAREDYDYAAYEASTYASNLARETDYEPVYDKSDYTSLLARQGDVGILEVEEGAEYETRLGRQGELGVLTEASVGVASNLATKTKVSLSEVYGDTDASAYGDGRQDPAALSEVYNQEDTIDIQELTGEERASALLAAYAASSYVSNLIKDDGINAAEDDDTVIEPTI